MNNEEFKAWRKRLGLTQAQAGEALGLSRWWIGYMEKGIDDKGNPVLVSKTVSLACEALEIRHSKKS